MADTIMTAAAELAAVIPEVWSANFYPTLLEKLPFNGSIARDYEGEIRQLGDTVNITDWPQFDEAQEILEGEKADADGITANNTQLVINKQLVKDYIITKKAMIQSIDSQTALRNLAMHSVMKKMQSILIAETVPSAAAPDHSIAYTSGTTLQLVDILAAKQLLDDADVEEMGRTMIVGSSQYNDMFNITGFISKDFIPAGSPLSAGAITLPILGFDFKWTTEAGDTSYFFHPIYMQMAVQQTPQVNVYDLGNEGRRAMRVNLDVLFGVRQLSDKRVVTIS